MQIIYTDGSQVVATEERDPDRKPATAREEIARMFDMMSCFAGWKRPLAELEDLYLRGAQEAIAQMEEDRAAFNRLWVWQRAWRRLRKRVPEWVDQEASTMKDVVGMYVAKLIRFHNWMDCQRQTSRFYRGEFGEEMAKCNSLVTRLKARMKTL